MTEKSLIDEKFSDIEYNLKAIREDIAEAAIKSGRRPEDIDFMADWDETGFVVVDRSGLSRPP